MTPRQAKILSDITAIKNKLDQSYDTDRDYLPPLLQDLRTYILQVHSSHETSLELIIYTDYLKSSQPFWDFSDLFSRMTFGDKLRLVHKLHVSFPNRQTVKLNELRNVFAHQKGEIIRNTYGTDEKRLEVYQLLQEAHDALNVFFEQQQAMADQSR